MKRILVPSDGSSNSLRAVERAATAVAESRDRIEVTLLHVLDAATFTSLGAALAPDALARERPAAVDEALRPAEQILQKAEVPYDIRWRVGSPAEEIAAELDQRPYDSVIMGTRGMGPIANLMLGSVATRVQYLADVPLTFVK